MSVEIKMMDLSFCSDAAHNVVNSEAHIQTTAKEIWTQTAGQIHGFTCAVGTGGTLAGVSIGLKERNKISFFSFFSIYYIVNFFSSYCNSSANCIYLFN